MINTRTIFVKKLISSLACLLMGLTPQYSFAIDPPSPPASEARQTDSREPQAPKFSDEELEKLLAPIALYPDALLAQLLPASAYPLQIVEAHCVKKTRKRHAVREMEVDPSEPPCRRRLQTAMSCFGQKPRW